MRKLSLVLALVISGCCAPNKLFLNAVAKDWSVIEPEYRAYLAADPNISAESKVTRARTADELTKVIAEAQKGVTQ